MLITPLYAGLLALLYLTLSYRIVVMRGPGGPSLGDGGNPILLRRIRGHGNFAEYVPLILLMIAMLELGHQPAWLIHALGATLLVARLLHGYALSFTEAFKFGRWWGTALTFLLLLVCGGLCVWQSVQAQGLFGAVS
ncbi:MAG: MAPEG family protein [Xanthomonadales bacterium]|nr:MAPEG family protein [Xanthomonadales bacterium]MBK7144349.1 MAPEG family protein [Xanthomonadales bacterium]MCC6560568.1 MAPEG family protein [Xanthomonadales bacterium]